MIVGGCYALADWWLRNPDVPREELMTLDARASCGSASGACRRASAGTLKLGGNVRTRRGNSPRVTAQAPLRVLGIDPGTASTGFGVVELGGAGSAAPSAAA